jgi:hypothetical protein
MLFREAVSFWDIPLDLRFCKSLKSLAPVDPKFAGRLFSSCKASVLSRSLFHLDRLVEVELMQTDSWKVPFTEGRSE